MTKHPAAKAALLSSALILGTAPFAGAASAAPAHARTAVYTHADSGKTVRVGHGHTFKVRLKVCEDCGYHWSFKKRPDKHIVKLVDKTDVSSATPPAVGGINTVTWTYRVVGTGKTTMRLVELTPAQKVAKRFALTVKAHRSA